MKNTFFISFFIVICINAFGQIDVDLQVTNEFEAKESAYHKTSFLTADDKMFYAVSTKYVDKKDGYSSSGTMAIITGYNVQTLKPDFESELILPALNAEELLFHGAYPSADGLNIVYSFYDKKNNERVIALARMNLDGDTSPEVTRLSATPRNNQFASSVVSLHYQQGNETALIVERSPVKGAAMVATSEFQSDVYLIHLTKNAEVLSNNMIKVGEKKKYEMSPIKASDNGTLLLRTGQEYKGETVLIHGVSGKVIILPNPKDQIGNDFFYTEPLELFQKTSGEVVSLEVLHSTVKGGSARIVGFRTATLDTKGNLKTSFIHKIETDDNFGAKPDPTKTNFLRGFEIKSVSMSEDIVHISGFCLGELSLGNVNSIGLNTSTGSYTEHRCERFFKPKGSYATRSGYGYTADGKAGFIQMVPVDWMNESCSNLERITKKNGEGREVALGYQTLNLEGNSPIEKIMFNGEKLPSKIFLREILPINDRFLGVFLGSGKTYFGWLPEL